MSEQAVIEVGFTAYFMGMFFTIIMMMDDIPEIDGGLIRYSAIILMAIFWPIPWICFIVWKVFT